MSIVVERGAHRATVFHAPEVGGYAWTCCWDERLGDIWSLWDTLPNLLRDLSIHLHQETP